MTNQRRVIVIGAGVAGLTTALKLLERGGTDVTLLERYGPGFGSSSKSAGVVETQYLDRSGIEVRDFGLRYFEKFSADYRVNLTRSGYLRLAQSEKDMKLFQQSIDLQKDFQITDPVLLSAEEISTRWPRIRTEGRVGGVFGPSDGYVESYEYTLAAASRVVALGGTISSGVALETAEQDAAGTWTLATTRGKYEADVVVNAAGPWAKDVAMVFGADMPQNNQLRPKVKISHTERADPLLPFVMDYVPGSGQDGIYFRSETPHELFVGIHTDESIQEERDPNMELGEAPPEFINRVNSLLPQRLEVPEGAELGKSWTGLYAISPDNKPLVGEHPGAAGVIHVMGAGGSGIQLAPAMAQMATELVLDETVTSFPGTDWSPTRLSMSASSGS